MKRFLLLSMLMVVGLCASAQQEFKYNHFMFNTLSINPASAGMKDGISAMLLHRTQWAGFGPGSPLTTTFTVHSPVKLLHGGIGLSVLNDEFGFSFKTQGASLNYSYHKKFNNGTLGIGVNLGFMRRSLDPSKFKPVDGGDPNIPTGISSDMMLDMGFGAWFTAKNYYIGLSASHLNAGSLKLENTNASIPFDRVFYLQGGYTYPINDKFDLLPNALVKLGPATQVDINTNLMYSKKIWLGLSYSSLDAVSTLIGAQIMQGLKFGYSYDITTSKLRTVQDGTHEIFVSYDFSIKIPPKPKIVIKSPRFL